MTHELPPTPMGDRVARAESGYPGLTQVQRNGRCFQLRTSDPAATAILDNHAFAVAMNLPLPDYGKRWRGEERGS